MKKLVGATQCHRILGKAKDFSTFQRLRRCVWLWWPDSNSCRSSVFLLSTFIKLRNCSYWTRSKQVILNDADGWLTLGVWTRERSRSPSLPCSPRSLSLALLSFTQHLISLCNKACAAVDIHNSKKNRHFSWSLSNRYLSLNAGCVRYLFWMTYSYLSTSVPVLWL